MSATATATASGSKSWSQRFEAWIDHLDDRTNPIVVKELRQAVQGKFLAGMLLFFLLLQLLVVAGFLLGGAGQNGQAAGQETFLTLQGILLFVAFFFLPISVVVRLFRERSDQNLDLMFITTLSPTTIIRGKFFAGLVLAVLLFSACMPFLVLTYFLRGIDLPSILIVVFASFTGVALTLLVAIFVGCLVRHPVLRVLVGIGGLLQLLTAYTFLQTGMALLLTGNLGSRLDEWRFWGWAGAFLILAVLAGGALFVLSVALIMPVTANRARPVRRYFTLVWGVTLILAVTVTILTSQADPLFSWLGSTACFVALAMVVSVCAPDSLSRRVLSRLPDPEEPHSAWKRRWAFVFSSGAGGGLVWASLLGVATIAVGTVASVIDIGGLGVQEELAEVTARTTGFLAYTLAYVLLALGLQRLLPKRVPRRQTWLLFLLLVSASLVIPLVLALLIDVDNVGWAWILSPFGIFSEGLLPLALLISGVAATVMALVHIPWLLRQFVAFRRPEPVVVPPVDAAPIAEQAELPRLELPEVEFPPEVASDLDVPSEAAVGDDPGRDESGAG